MPLSFPLRKQVDEVRTSDQSSAKRKAPVKEEAYEDGDEDDAEGAYDDGEAEDAPRRRSKKPAAELKVQPGSIKIRRSAHKQ